MVSLGTTLINLGVKTLVKFGGWDRIEDAKTTSTDIFIGAAVTRFGETKPAIDLAGILEIVWGFVLGYVKQLNVIDLQGYYYRDYDAPFAANKWVLVGIPRPNGVYLVLSETNTTIAIGNRLKNDAGVFLVAQTGENFQMIAEEAVTATADTRKYFWARWVHN